MKTAISIPDPLFQAAETLANRLGLSRSELYARAVESFIKQHRNHGVTELLDHVYSTESNSLEDGYHALQTHSVNKEAW